MSTTGADLAWLGSQFPKLKGLAHIGRGGQKQVFKADHAHHGAIALKLYHPGSNLQRMVREIQAAKALDSPRIAKLLDFGTLSTPTGEIVWVIEQLVPGRPLRAHLGAGRLTNAQILVVAAHVLSPLAVAERHRIVHRDVKPENIILDDNPIGASLIDFGVLRALDLDSLTESARASGPATLGYAPLEQLRNMKRDIDSRADLFGLGVTLYECCEGVNPLTHGTADRNEVVRRTENLAIPRITRTVEPSGQFVELVFTMTRARRDHRLGSISEALDWLREILGPNATLIC